MGKLEAVENEEDVWESGKLGKDAAYVKCASPELKKEIESALGFQMISVRLQKSLIDDLKLIAEYRGVSGYQPLMRDILCRFARSEISQIARELHDQQEAREKLEAHQAKIA